jgi:hypothetical protein
VSSNREATGHPLLSSGCRFFMGAPRIFPRGAPACRKRVRARASEGRGAGLPSCSPGGDTMSREKADAVRFMTRA